MTPLLTRARRAWNVLRGQSPGSGRSQKKAPFLWMDYRNGEPHWHITDYQAYVDEGYNLNSLIRSAVAYKERAIASVRLVAVRGDPQNPERVPPSHPLARLCARPNPYQSFELWQRQRVNYLNLSGNSYTFLDRPRRGETPGALYNLRPDRTFVVPDRQGGLAGYYYRRDHDANPKSGLPVLTSDMMHSKFTNPADPLEGLGYGLSPLASIARSGDVDNRVTDFLKLFFESGAMPAGVLSSDLSLDEPDFQRIRDIWNERYGGVEKWADVAVLDKSTKYQRIGMTFDEMGFEKLDERNESRILGPFGVPPILLGTRMGLNRATMANYEEARRQCWEDTLLPELRLLESVDQYYLQGDDDAYVIYDTSSVPALQKDVPKLVEAAHRMWTMGTPRDLAYASVGLRVDDSTPGGDVSYIPTSVMPAGSAAPPPAPTNEDPMIGVDEDARSDAPKGLLPNPTAKGWGAEDKARLWKAADDLAVAHEAAFQREAAAQFELDKRSVLALISEAKRSSLRRKAAIQWEALSGEVGDVFSAAGDRWREAYAPLIRGVVEDAAGHWQVETGIAFDVENLEAQAWFVDYLLQFSTPITDTSTREIAALLQQGTREGWSVGEMQKALEQLFRQWMDGDVEAADFAGERLPPWRTELIARTETVRAFAAGSWQLYKDAGVAEKEWLATTDERTRDSHRSADGQVRALDAAFDVGGYAMQYPGDMRSGAPLDEVANCRCTLLPVVEV